MSKLIRRWAVTSGYHKGAKIEQFQLSNGETHYSFRDRYGRPSNVSEKELDKLIKVYKMEEIDLSKITITFNS